MDRILIAEGFEDLVNVTQLARRRVESVINFASSTLDVIDGYLGKAITNRNRDTERQILFEAVELTRNINVGVRLSFEGDTRDGVGGFENAVPVRILNVNKSTTVALTLYVFKYGPEVTFTVRDTNNDIAIEKSVVYTQGWMHVNLQMATGTNASCSLSIDGAERDVGEGNFIPSELVVDQTSLFLPPRNTGIIGFDDYIISRTDIDSSLIVTTMAFDSEELQDTSENSSVNLEANETLLFDPVNNKVRGEYRAVLCHYGILDTNGTNYPFTVSIGDTILIDKTFPVNAGTQFFTVYVQNTFPRGFFSGLPVKLETGS